MTPKQYQNPNDFPTTPPLQNTIKPPQHMISIKITWNLDELIVGSEFSLRLWSEEAMCIVKNYYFKHNLTLTDILSTGKIA